MKHFDFGYSKTDGPTNLHFGLLCVHFDPEQLRLEVQHFFLLPYLPIWTERQTVLTLYPKVHFAFGQTPLETTTSLKQAA